VSISQLLGELYETVDNADSIKDFLRSLERHTAPANNAAWCVVDRVSGEIEYRVGSATDDLLEQYQARLDEELRMDAMFHLGRGMHIARNRDLIDEESFRRTSLCRDVLIPADLVDVLSAIVLQDDLAALLILNHGHQAAGFDRHVEQQLRCIFPHFQRAVRLSMNARLASSELNAPTIQVADGGRVIAFNERAQDYLARGDLMTIRKGRLHALDHAADQQFQRAVTSAITRNLHPPEPIRELLAVGTPPNTCLLWVSPRTHIRRDFTRDRTAVVVVLDPETIADTDVATGFGLTPAEHSLLSALLTGQTVTQYAAVRNRSVHTIRTQLKSLMHKTGARSQLELVRRFVHPIH
jgi:DNA-binding CsgD family transcriptional regulator/PAS domain-containing protein